MTPEDVKALVIEVLNEPVTLKFKKLIEQATTPVRKNSTDSCFDVYATSKSIEGNYIEYGTGVSLVIPEGYEVKLFARSSISNTGMVLANSVGVIDETYRLDLMVRFKSVYPYAGQPYNIGDRIAQIQLVKRVPTVLEEVTEVSQTGRGGFGSTGR